MTRSDTTANHANIQALAIEFGLSEETYSRAQRLAKLTPDRNLWLTYINRFLVALGALLIVAGITAFFAWNWADLNHLAKLALVQVGIIASALLAWRLGIDTVGGKASLFSTVFLFGIVFAVFGQVYQTGADPYGLFLLWALLALPMAVIGRQPALWMLFQVLLILALIMYWTQVVDPPDGWWQISQLLGPLIWLSTTLTNSILASLVFLINALALIVWEFALNREVVWMRGRSFPRVVAFLALTSVLIPTLIFIIAASFGESNKLSFISPLLYATASVVAFYYYQFRRPDLLMLTLCVFSVVLVLTTWVGQNLVDNESGLLLLAVLLIAQVAGAAYWLRSVSRRWESVT